MANGVNDDTEDDDYYTVEMDDHEYFMNAISKYPEVYFELVPYPFDDQPLVDDHLERSYCTTENHDENYDSMGQYYHQLHRYSEPESYGYLGPRSDHTGHAEEGEYEEEYDDYIEDEDDEVQGISQPDNVFLMKRKLTLQHSKYN